MVLTEQQDGVLTQFRKQFLLKHSYCDSPKLLQKESEHFSRILRVREFGWGDHPQSPAVAEKADSVNQEWGPRRRQLRKLDPSLRRSFKRSGPHRAIKGLISNEGWISYNGVKVRDLSRPEPEEVPSEEFNRLRKARCISAGTRINIDPPHLGPLAAEASEALGRCCQENTITAARIHDRIIWVAHCPVHKEFGHSIGSIIRAQSFFLRRRCHRIEFPQHAKYS